MKILDYLKKDLLILDGGMGTLLQQNGLSAGELPDFVQIWNPPCEKADMMIITTHSDDEQLFFALCLFCR